MARPAPNAQQGRACTSAHQMTLELWISVFQPLQCHIEALCRLGAPPPTTQQKAPDPYLSRFSILMSRLRSSHVRTQSIAEHSPTGPLLS